MKKRCNKMIWNSNSPTSLTLSNKKMRRDCHRCWVVCFGMDLRPSDRCHGGHMVLWFLLKNAFGPRFNLFFLRFVKGVLEIWKESNNFRFTSCLTFFWVRYVDAIGRNDVGHLRKRFQIYSNLLEAFFAKTNPYVGLEQSKGILFV